MSGLVERNRDVIVGCGLEPNIFKLIEQSGIDNIHGYIGHLVNDAKRGLEAKTISSSFALLRSICNAFKYFDGNNLCDWSVSLFKNLCSRRYDKEQSDFSELEAFGHLRSSFYNLPVVSIRTDDGRNGKTPDFKVGDDLYVEVYCPDESNPEKIRVQDELDKSLCRVPVVISRPVTGSATDALRFPTNQTIARVVGVKRSNDQFRSGEKNILWIDVKQKLNLHVRETLAFRSIRRANETYIGCFGIWHSFYGEVGKSIFPCDRYTLRFDMGRECKIYKQHRHQGLFREREHLSGAVLSCLDGIVLFLNPWCQDPLSDEQIRRFAIMNGFRPEFSLFVKSTLASDVLSKERQISFLTGCEME